MALLKSGAFLDLVFPIDSSTKFSHSLAKIRAQLSKFYQPMMLKSRGNCSRKHDALFDLKKEIEIKLPEATMVISTPLKQNDIVGAGQIIEMLNRRVC